MFKFQAKARIRLALEEPQFCGSSNLTTGSIPGGRSRFQVSRCANWRAIGDLNGAPRWKVLVLAERVVDSEKERGRI